MVCLLVYILNWYKHAPYEIIFIKIHSQDDGSCRVISRVDAG